MPKTVSSRLQEFEATARAIDGRPKGEQDLLIARVGFRQLTMPQLERILTDRELKVASLRLGREDGAIYTLAGVADTLGIGEERARQLQGTAARKLREHGVGRRLAQELLKALGNETRRRILHFGIRQDPDPISPSKASRELGVSLHLCSNHFKVLVATNLLLPKDTVQKRGRVEQLFILSFELLSHPIARSIMVAFMDPTANTSLK